MRQPIDSALSVVQDIVGRLGLGREAPAAEEFMVVVRDFERIGFDVPVGADSDGFLFSMVK